MVCIPAGSLCRAVPGPSGRRQGGEQPSGAWPPPARPWDGCSLCRVPSSPKAACELAPDSAVSFRRSGARWLGGFAFLPLPSPSGTRCRPRGPGDAVGGFPDPGAAAVMQPVDVLSPASK